jgi:hypothetical protein
VHSRIADTFTDASSPERRRAESGEDGCLQPADQSRNLGMSFHRPDNVRDKNF